VLVANLCAHQHCATISFTGRASTVTLITVAGSSKNVSKNIKVSVILQQRMKFLRYA